jgi:hypothetical protein
MLLTEKRQDIVKGNRGQISKYLQSLRSKATSKGEFLTPGVTAGDLVEVLVSPSAEGLASLIYPTRQVASVDPHSGFRAGSAVDDCGHGNSLLCICWLV